MIFVYLYVFQSDVLYGEICGTMDHEQKLAHVKTESFR